jgi:hypothetical protein
VFCARGSTRPRASAVSDADRCPRASAPGTAERHSVRCRSGRDSHRCEFATYLHRHQRACGLDMECREVCQARREFYGGVPNRAAAGPCETAARTGARRTSRNANCGRGAALRPDPTRGPRALESARRVFRRERVAGLPETLCPPARREFRPSPEALHTPQDSSEPPLESRPFERETALADLRPH